MLNNDILRRVRYITDYNDLEMIEVFNQADATVTEDQLNHWLKKEGSTNFKKINDSEMALFLNGLINEKRGKKEGATPKAETILTNNIVFRKLMIAFDLKTDEVIQILKMANLNVGRGELSSFFRNPEHRNFRECKAQILRNFLNGMEIKFRGNTLVKGKTE
jgi:uncharacterized protein YehS (DUF1456 family)